MKPNHSYQEFLTEQKLFEIGEGTKPFPWKQRSGVVIKDWLKTMEEDTRKGASVPWETLNPLTFDFKGKKGSYYLKVSMGYKNHVTFNFGKKPDIEPHKFNIILVASFDVDIVGNDNAMTNFGEQFSVITTVSDILQDVIVQLDKVKWVRVEEIHIEPKLEDYEEGVPIAQSKRGKLYLEYIKKQGRRLPGDWSVIIKDDAFLIKRGKWSTATQDKAIDL